LLNHEVFLPNSPKFLGVIDGPKESCPPGLSFLGWIKSAGLRRSCEKNTRNQGKTRRRYSSPASQGCSQGNRERGDSYGGLSPEGAGLALRKMAFPPGWCDPDCNHRFNKGRKGCQANVGNTVRSTLLSNLRAYLGGPSTTRGRSLRRSESLGRSTASNYFSELWSRHFTCVVRRRLHEACARAQFPSAP